ncbi:MAG: single-stranded DNA-binding protein [Cyanobacteriota/Melainabacteria group bacterium]
MNNQLTLVGHVGQDPRSISFEDTGNKVVKFSLAVKEYSANKDEKATLWIDVDCWNGLGDRVLNVITKGREVVITGRLAMTTFTKEIDGVSVKMSKPFVRLTSFHLCGPRPASDEAIEKKLSAKKKLAVAK